MNPKFPTIDALGPGPSTAASTIVTSTAGPVLFVLASAATATLSLFKLLALL